MEPGVIGAIAGAIVGILNAIIFGFKKLDIERVECCGSVFVCNKENKRLKRYEINEHVGVELRTKPKSIQFKLQTNSNSTPQANSNTNSNTTINTFPLQRKSPSIDIPARIDLPVRRSIDSAAPFISGRFSLVSPMPNQSKFQRAMAKADAAQSTNLPRSRSVPAEINKPSFSSSSPKTTTTDTSITAIHEEQQENPIFPLQYYGIADKDKMARASSISRLGGRPRDLRIPAN